MEQQVPTEAKPKMVQTERSSRPSKKSSSTHSTHIHEAVRTIQLSQFIEVLFQQQ